MKKLTVSKDEGIAEVIDRILSETDKDITLVVPKGSMLGKTVSNFHLLKRESDAAGKSLAVESVDDGILALAKDSAIAATHPLWSGVRTGGLSDIVPREKEKEAPVAEAAAPAASVSSDRHDSEDDVMSPEEYTSEERDRSRMSMTDMGDAVREKYRSKKALFWAIGAIIIIIIGIFVVGGFFSHADITIAFNKTPWSYSNNFVADKSVSTVGASSNVIPAQVFSVQKNTTEMFPASASAVITSKAQGTITIYNNYSTAPQDLVVKTRFVTPDGKVFRLVSDVTVPGAQSANGKLTPSSINAQIIADQAGADYNLGPVARLTIPGFQGSPKYDGFYGAITGTTTGGGTGKHAVPTAADVTDAKTKTTARLQEALQSSLASSYPNNFKILDGATSIQVTKLTVNTSTDANGNFSVFGEATMQAVGFDENALKSYLLTLAEGQGANLAFHDLKVDYSNVTASMAKGQVNFSLTAQGNLEPAFSADVFAKSIAGKSISDAKNAISTLPSLKKGEISVWPFWLWSIPSDPKKVRVSAD